MIDAKIRRSWLAITCMAVALVQAAYACALADDVVADTDVRPISFEDLSYPLTARLKHIEGVVVVRLKVDDHGHVAQANALSGARELVSASLENAKKWRFHSNSANTVILVYRFIIEGLCNQPCRSHFEFRPPNFAAIRIGEPVVDHAARDK